MAPTRKKKSPDVASIKPEKKPIIHYYSEAELEQRFWSAISAEVARHSFTISQGCSEIHIKPFIRNGIIKLNQELYEDDEHYNLTIELAEANLVSLAIRMIIEAPKTLREIHEDYFLAAKKKFCPCWPFCQKVV